MPRQSNHRSRRFKKPVKKLRFKRRFNAKRKSFKRGRSVRMGPKQNHATLVEAFQSGVDIAAVKTQVVPGTQMNFGLFSSPVGSTTTSMPWVKAQNDVGVNILGSFPRVAAEMQNWRYWRVTEVEWKYYPQYNTYQSGGGAPAANTIPRMFKYMDRSGLFAYTTVQEIQDAGVRGSNFIGRPVVIKYVPSTVANMQVGGGPAVPNLSTPNIQIHKSKYWFPTDDGTGVPPNIPFLGHQVIFQQDDFATGEPQIKWDVTIKVEFKIPSIPSTL